MQALATRVHGRDNNLNLIRFLAAATVLASHCYPLSRGASVADPLFDATGYSVGAVAVDVFFVTSGFLVTGSLLSRQDLFQFVASRLLRIYPALLVMILLTVVAAGLASPVRGFFFEPQTVRYVIQNAAMIFGAKYELPGVFASNPIQTVNGSLWTLPWELRAYACLAVLWLALAAFRARRVRIMELAVVWVALGSVAILLVPSATRVFPTWTGTCRFLPTFFAGGAFYVLRQRIPLSALAFFGTAAALVLGLLHAPFLYYLALPYVTVYLAYAPRGFALRFNEVGDYSYGIYIYAYPVQQTIAAAVPGVGVGGMFALAFPVTFAFAWCSWHFVESPALRLKTHPPGFRATRSPVQADAALPAEEVAP